MGTLAGAGRQIRQEDFRGDGCENRGRWVDDGMDEGPRVEV